MTDQLISFEVAKLAEEKGFKEDCQFHIVEHTDENGNKRLVTNHVYVGYRQPTQSLLQKYLRENHKLHIEIFIGFNNKFGYYIHNLNTKNISDRARTRIFVKAQWDKYEDALEIAEQQTLKLLP